MQSSFKIRLEKRLEAPRWLNASTPPLAMASALVVGGIILFLSGKNPIDVFHRMFQAGFTNRGALSATLKAATPLLFTGLAASLAFRMKVWNIGADGQLMVAAVFAVPVGVELGEQSLAVSLPVMVIAGMTGGALWAAVPALLRAYLNTNEVLTTLMLNYVAPLLLAYLVFNSRSYWRDLSSASAQMFPVGKPIAESAFWPQYGTGIVVPFGLVLGVVVAVLLRVLVRNTRFGFQMRLVADSPAAGHYSGIRTKRLFVFVMLLSGAIAGLAGTSQIGDFRHLLEPRTLGVVAYGYTGIAVGALARYNPLGVIVSAFIVGGILNAGYALQGPDLPLGLVGVIQGILMLFVAASELTSRYRVVVSRRPTPVHFDPNQSDPGPSILVPPQNGTAS